MKVSEATTDTGYVLTIAGKQFGKVFLSESGKISPKSENARWFATYAAAMDYSGDQSQMDNQIWVPISW